MLRSGCMAKRYRTVEVRRDGMTYERRQPLHHKINKAIAHHEVERLDKEIQGLEERKKKAERRVREAIA